MPYLPTNQPIGIHLHESLHLLSSFFSHFVAFVCREICFPPFCFISGIRFCCFFLTPTAHIRTIYIKYHFFAKGYTFREIFFPLLYITL